MNDIVVQLAAAVLGLALTAWILLSIVVVLGRAWYDRRHRLDAAPLSGRKARRVVRRALEPTRTDWGRSRRIAALARLAGARHPALRRLLRRAIADPDHVVAAAAVRLLGELGDEWAIDLLLDALRAGHVPRSRVAAQLERLAPVPGAQLLPLLRDPEPQVRFWGATLLASYGQLGQDQLLALARDLDPNVRAAVVETLGERGGPGAADVALALLDDPAWFVRVHAARAAGHVAGERSARLVAHLLADDRWWVRTAAKDALRTIGAPAVEPLLPVLTSPDEFARNGAAEVLQDIGFVDYLATKDPASPLLARIYLAGGDGLRRAAELRARTRRDAEEARAA
jgi:HEAT repeat protein